MSAAVQRYSVVAVVLHWLIGIAIVAMIAAGLIMTNMTPGSTAQFQLYQLHKSVGITVLLLSFVRLAWRLMHPVPPLPTTLKPWEHVAARVTHFGFYVLMIAVPFTGWAMVSASVFNIPTLLYGVIPWPHLPFLPDLANKEPIEEALSEIHELLAFGIVALLILHIGAALKHHFVLKDDVVTRMMPFLKRPKA
jgi:cytochrome b561